MKRLNSYLLLVIAVAACTTAFAQQPVAKQVKNSDQLYNVFFKDLKFGNAAYSQAVLRAWKDYDNNTLDNSAAIFADDLLVTLPDGTVLKGKAEAMKGIKEWRGSFASVSSEVHAVTTLKSPNDPDREVVSIWGLETATKKDGTVMKTQLNEVWFFNTAGKVVEMHQLAAKYTEPPKKQ